MVLTPDLFPHRLEGMKDIDAILGKARYQQNRRNFSGALELVNQLIVAYSGFVPGVIEKMKVLLALQNWDEALDAANR